MSFGDAVSTCFSKYATFSGRASRPEFWWFILFSFIVGIVASILDSILGTKTSTGLGMIGGIASLALLLPQLAVGARRLHDTGRSGWWQLLLLLPCVGVIVLIVFWCLPPKTEQYAQPGYGAPPVA